MMIETLRVLKVSAPRAAIKQKFQKGCYVPTVVLAFLVVQVAAYFQTMELDIHEGKATGYAYGWPVEVWLCEMFGVRRILDCMTPMCWEDGYGLGMSCGPAGQATVGVTTSQQWNIILVEPFGRKAGDFWFLNFQHADYQSVWLKFFFTLVVQTLVISATVKALFQVLQNGNGEACSGVCGRGSGVLWSRDIDLFRLFIYT